MSDQHLFDLMDQEHGVTLLETEINDIKVAIHRDKEEKRQNGNHLCPLCGGNVDPKGWLDGQGNRGPECEDCGATARSMEIWNSRDIN
jgi:tRNA(Ile2) C34 agmatinyltransferase TiaS